MTVQKDSAGHALIVSPASLFRSVLHHSRPSRLLPHHLHLLWISLTKVLLLIAFLRVLPRCHLRQPAAGSAVVSNLTLVMLVQALLMPNQSIYQNWNVAVAVAAVRMVSADVAHLVEGVAQIWKFQPSLTQVSVSLQQILLQAIHAVVVASQ